MFKSIISTLVAGIILLGNVSAATITYTLTDNGSSNFTADFSVTNDTLGAPIEEFTIFFDLGLFENLAGVLSPADWDGLAIDPDAGIPDDGFVDWLALGTPLGIGETLSGFVVSFDFLGVGLPEMLAFNIIDPFTFDTLESGFATLDGNVPQPIPLPAAIWLFGLGAALLFSRRTQ